MKKIFLVLSCVLVSSWATSQEETSQPGEIPPEQEEKGPEPAPISEYKIISIDRDTTFVDTTLTIYKNYRFNYLRQDNFELLPFPNVGQTYNRLVYEFGEDDQVLPSFGARARHFNFMEAEDIYYYHVPTPLTELFFKTVYEQGQILDAFFTINTSENLNLSIAYKGLRSLGKYQHMLTSTGNFRTTVSYHTSDKRYYLNTHFVSQDLMNEENGGLTDRSVENFLSKNPEFEDRSRLDVRFQDAQSTLYGKRFYLDHSFGILGNGPEAAIKVGHRLNYSYKKFEFKQAEAHDFFGPSFEEVNIHDETRLESIYNEAFVEFVPGDLGRLRLKGAHTHYDYGYNTVLQIGNGFIGNRLTGDVFSAGATYTTRFSGFDLKTDGMLNLAGDKEGFNLEGTLSYTLDEDIWAGVKMYLNNRAPNWNFLLFQSDYINYNWQNNFSNVNSQGLQLQILAPGWINLQADYTRVGNYTYFGETEEGLIKPFQFKNEVNYAKLKAVRDFEFGKFGLANTLLFQKVLAGEEVLNVPTFITRNSFYYQDYWFKKALYLQTGFTVNYFPGYEMNGYDPVLAEFFVQNERVFEDLRTLDFFFNGKVRQTRIFFKLERLDALLLGNTNFSAPLYPYRDFGIRFGLVWNFFM